MSMHKKTQGRKKIEIKKIVKENSRQVTFSKRRNGLFNKASELCVLTGAETAIIIESPGNRVYAFGHPSVDSVVDKYLAGSSSMSSQYNELLANGNLASTNESFNLKYKQITKEIDDEKKKNVVVENKVEGEDGTNFWWEEPFEDLGLDELEKYINAMEKLKDKLTMTANEMVMIRNSSSFDVNQSSTNEGLDAFMMGINQSTDDGGDTDQMLDNYSPRFNFGSAEN